jgi:hypothetical protein
MELTELIDSAVACYRFTKAEMTALHGDQFSVAPMLVVYDGKGLALSQLGAPELLRWVLAEETDADTKAVVFQADTLLTFVDPLGLPTDAASCLLTIGVDKDLVVVRGTIYYPTPSGLMFESADQLDVSPFNKEVALLQSVFR